MYKLSSTLIAHQSDVKAVSFPDANTIYSVSRDATCRLWSRNEGSTSWAQRIEYSGDSYLNSLATDNVTTYVGCLNGSIAVRGLGGLTKWTGHEKNVCALDAKDGLIASGSWDCTARVWTADGQTLHVLKGHTAAVWGVRIVDKDTVLTASADKTIRIWKNGKQISVIQGHSDVVRSLCLIGNGEFASCSNDTTIKIWNLDGKLIRTLAGHTSYVYMVDVLPSGELVSCGEDRSVRIWSGERCIQVITLPCTSVWSVAVDKSGSGDFVAGGSDYYIRTFSRNEDRWASKDELEALAEAVAGSGIGKDQVGEVNKEDLKGPEALKEKGSSEGQILMIKNDEGHIEAHQWASGIWIKIGEVVGSAASGPQKVMYEGKQYDYVFKVNIEEGQPELSLPYNVTDNPYIAAQKFLDRHELPSSYLDEVARFITTNSESVNISSAPAQDPYGTRYTPAGTGGGLPSESQQVRNTKIIPHKTYLQLSSFQPDPIVNAVKKNNALQSTDKQLSNLDIELVESALRKLDAHNASSVFATAVKIIQNWSPEQSLPGYDLLRISLSAYPNPPTASVVQMVFGALDPGVPKHSMLAVRSLVNLFSSKEGQKLVSTPDVREHALNTLRDIVQSQPQANTARDTSVATLILNYSILMGSNSDLAFGLLETISFFASTVQNMAEEPQYRLLLAFGTALANNLDEETKQASRGFGLVDWANSATNSQRETELVREISSLF